MGVREDEGTVRGGGLVKHVQPPSTVNYSREALLCTGETLAEFRGLEDGRVRGGRVREGMLVDVVSEGSVAEINRAVGRAHSNSEGQGAVRDVSSGKGSLSTRTTTKTTTTWPTRWTWRSSCSRRLARHSQCSMKWAR